MLDRTSTALPAIPVISAGPDFPVTTLVAELPRAHALLDLATKGVPLRALRVLDQVSRKWLVRNTNAHLSEIDAIARTLDRPGAYFLSVNYEWGCTCKVGPNADHSSSRLIRVLDWLTPGLGRNVIAAKVDGAAGSYLTLTWPGYTGVLQGMAPGRFSAALNQAPMRRSGGGFLPLDWAMNKRRVWRMPHCTPAHLLRNVFERAASYEEARRMLIETPIASPAIFTLAGIAQQETCVIERTEVVAQVHDGPGVATNNWQAAGWKGRARGNDSAGRACQMASVELDFNDALPWLRAPILNPYTRLVFIADAKQGRLTAQGFEAERAATAVLHYDA
jgi:Linear amide C-N hydrolases, choloylglycine hydrolase family